MRACVAALVMVLAVHCSRQPAPPRSPAGWLPQAGEAGEWRPAGGPQRATGEALFDLIDGGAEIYLEYGFRQTLHQTYRSSRGKSINLELYEMSDPAAAYGVYSFKSSAKGQPLAICQAARLEGYYLNCWKGRFVITVVGLDTEPDTLAGLTVLTRAAAGRIEPGGDRPALVKLFDGDDRTEVKYLRGSLGLFNQSAQAAELAKGFEHGVAATRQDGQLIVLHYGSPARCRQAFEAARQRARTGNEAGMKDGPAAFTFTSRDGRASSIEADRAHLFVSWGKDDRARADWLTRVKRALAR